MVVTMSEHPAVAYVNDLGELYNAVSARRRMGLDGVRLNPDDFEDERELGNVGLQQVSTIESYHDDLQEIQEFRGDGVETPDEAYEVLDAVNVGARDAADHLDLAQEYFDIVEDSQQVTRKQMREIREEAGVLKSGMYGILNRLLGYALDQETKTLAEYRALVEEIEGDYADLHDA